MDYDVHGTEQAMAKDRVGASNQWDGQKLAGLQATSFYVFVYTERLAFLHETMLADLAYLSVMVTRQCYILSLMEHFPL